MKNALNNITRLLSHTGTALYVPMLILAFISLIKGYGVLAVILGIMSLPILYVGYGIFFLLAEKHGQLDEILASMFVSSLIIYLLMKYIMVTTYDLFFL